MVGPEYAPPRSRKRAPLGYGNAIEGSWVSEAMSNARERVRARLGSREFPMRWRTSAAPG